MNKKKVCVLISAILILAVITVVVIKNRPATMYSHIAVGYSVEGYSQRKDIGYVILNIDNAKKR
jgi:hypothetical protein